MMGITTSASFRFLVWYGSFHFHTLAKLGEEERTVSEVSTWHFLLQIFLVTPPPHLPPQAKEPTWELCHSTYGFGEQIPTQVISIDPVDSL